MEKVYIVSDAEMAEYIAMDDIESVRAMLEEGNVPWVEVEEFDTEAEVLAFCRGLGHGKDETSMPSLFPLRSTEEGDIPFIRLLEEYL